MRIDLDLGPPQQSETICNSMRGTAVSVTSLGGSALAEEDQQFSESRAQVLALVAQARQFPELREERIHLLRQAVQSGHYQSSPEKVAGAIFAHLIADTAA
jgi:anti-sigma28 factor (negative regulator of flagellin synthesis)